jgi:CDP-glucose 4,6-dehydratase
MMTADFWRNRSVLVTGHTGFKGAWLAFWLHRMGAKVCGLAKAPATSPNLHDMLGLGDAFPGMFADINDAAALDELMTRQKPEVVLHLAAQALVRESYRAPVETFAANVTGTVSLLDAVRRQPSVKSVVIVTTDKCYENLEWPWPYRENDQLGGHDPYSASKGCAEIAAKSMRQSFFQPWVAKGHPARIATARAGNVIGGGDWSDNRLVPDIVRGCLGAAGEVRLRNPGAVRPWQHVLDPVAAYLMLAERLVTAPDGVDQAWNIGPDLGENRSVQTVAQAMVDALQTGRVVIEQDANAPHEANLLMLDCAKAKQQLGWKPRWSFDPAIRHTAEWYGAWHAGKDMRAMTERQIADFLQ